MRQVIDPGVRRRSVNMTDNIPYASVTDLEGHPLTLTLSICAQDGNSEMRLAAGREDEPPMDPMHCIFWIPGGGWRGCDKNLMVPEMQFFVEGGYVLASIYYRSSAQGHWPDQIQDVRAAIRFLRAHAEEYHIDPARIGVIGRSAGGQLAAMAAMNQPCDGEEPWGGQSARVQAACDLFGPVDLPALIREERERIQVPGYRWSTIEETHGAALLGVPDGQLEEAGAAASPVNFLSDAMCPLLILHGDQDLLVPCSISEDFYRRIVEAGYGDRADLYILKHAGHGTREFFQPMVKELILSFFDRVLKA